MIFVTGDTHGEVSRLSGKHFPEGKDLTKDDFVVICGDFGLIWDFHGETAEEKYWLDWLNDRPFTTLFIDGNHENFDRLYAYPAETLYGGKIHRVRASVIHLMRGEIFQLPDGNSSKKVFVFGGAKSHDIRDGVMDPEKDWEKIRTWTRENSIGIMPSRLFRIKGQTWWEQEMPSNQEMEEGIKNLDAVEWKVDYIFSHDCAPSIKKRLGIPVSGKQMEFDQFLTLLHLKCKYDKWFFGHLHNDYAIGEKDFLLYHSVVNVETAYRFMEDWKYL